MGAFITLHDNHNSLYLPVPNVSRLRVRLSCFGKVFLSGNVKIAYGRYIHGEDHAHEDNVCCCFHYLEIIHTL